MPRCIVCKDTMPPPFVEKLEDGAYKCIFCERGSNRIYGGPNKSKILTKEEIKKQYSDFLGELVKKKGIKNVVEEINKKTEEMDKKFNQGSIEE